MVTVIQIDWLTPSRLTFPDLYRHGVQSIIVLAPLQAALLCNCTSTWRSGAPEFLEADMSNSLTRKSGTNLAASNFRPALPV